MVDLGILFLLPAVHLRQKKVIKSPANNSKTRPLVVMVMNQKLCHISKLP